MPVLRALLVCLGIVLLLGAAVAAFVAFPEAVPGEHCLALRVTSTGQVVPVCPATRTVRHPGIAIGLTAAAAVPFVLAGVRTKPRRP